jgi:hypothetical protein
LFVPNRYPQDLTEAADSIISMTLRMLRAHGLRCLNFLAMPLLISLEIGRILKEFRALLAAFKAGTLILPAPAPAIVPQPRQAAPVQPAATRRPAARPAVSRRRRPRPQPAPAKPARAGVRVRAATIDTHATPRAARDRPRDGSAKNSVFLPCLRATNSLRFSNENPRIARRAIPVTIPHGAVETGQTGDAE